MTETSLEAVKQFSTSLLSDPYGQTSRRVEKAAAGKFVGVHRQEVVTFGGRGVDGV
jgi:hypothetical protein